MGVQGGLKSKPPKLTCHLGDRHRERRFGSFLNTTSLLEYNAREKKNQHGPAPAVPCYITRDVTCYVMKSRQQISLILAISESCCGS